MCLLSVIGEVLLRAGKMERTSSFNEVGTTEDAGESGSMECRRGRLEFRFVDVEIIQVFRSRNYGQGARFVFQHGTIPVLQLHFNGLLERPDIGRVSIYIYILYTIYVLINDNCVA